jgi:hypothetical protein
MLALAPCRGYRLSGSEGARYSDATDHPQGGPEDHPGDAGARGHGTPPLYVSLANQA